MCCVGACCKWCQVLCVVCTGPIHWWECRKSLPQPTGVSFVHLRDLSCSVRAAALWLTHVHPYSHSTNIHPVVAVTRSLKETDPLHSYITACMAAASYTHTHTHTHIHIHTINLIHPHSYQQGGIRGTTLPMPASSTTTTTTIDAFRPFPHRCKDDTHIHIRGGHHRPRVTTTPTPSRSVTLPTRMATRMATMATSTSTSSFTFTFTFTFRPASTFS